MDTEQALFRVIMNIGGEDFRIDYRSVVGCARDTTLAGLLDTTKAVCEIWSGDLKISSSPIETSQELRDSLIDNAQTILHGLRS